MAGRQEKVHSEILRHLYFGIDVDTEWDHLSYVVREVIISRVIGKSVQVSKKFQQWIDTRGIDMNEVDERLEMWLEEYRHKNTNLIPRIPNQAFKETTPKTAEPPSLPREQSAFLGAWAAILAISPAIVKWTAIICAGDANAERELMYSLRHCVPIQGILVWVLLSIWNGCRCMRNLWIYGMLIYQHKSLVEISWLANTGASRILFRDRIVAEMPRKTVTAFISRSETTDIRVEIFNGSMTQRPHDIKPEGVAVYDNQSRLVGFEVDDKKSRRQCVYHFAQDNKTRIPSSRISIEGDVHKVYLYDKQGRAAGGSVTISSTEYSFRNFYSSDTHVVSMTEFELTQSPKDDRLTVYWGVPLRHGGLSISDWMASEHVSQVERKTGSETYVTTYEYQHCRDPTTTTSIVGDVTEANVILQ